MITGVVLARNEARHIGACLASLRPYVAELILIDMESADETVALARPFIDKLITAKQTPNFDAARNLAIAEAQFEWLWYLDADERVSEPTARYVHDLLNQHGRDLAAIWIPFKTHFCGKWIEHSGWWPGYTMPRVLKKGRFRFPDRLHGGVEVDGQHFYLPPDPNLGIEHFSYSSVEHYLDKFNRYTSTESAQFQKTGEKLDWESGVRDMVRDWHHYFERCEGRKDGIHGWILAWLSGQYRWCSRAKLLDSTSKEAASQIAVPKSLDAAVEVIQDELARQRAAAPALPLGVIFHSPLWDPSGYAEDGRTILRALAGCARDVAARSIPWSHEVCPLAAAEKTLYRALERSKRPSHTIAITNCIATLVGPDPGASYNVLRTTNETDRIPEAWHARLSAFDEIWVLSAHNARAFRQSGVAPEKLRIVQPACDIGVFQPEGLVRARTAELAGRFVFLSVLDWQLRKGWDVLLKSYIEEFGVNDGAALLLKITRQHGHSFDAVQAQINRLLSETGTSLDLRTDILLWEECCDAPALAALYRSCDAFVLASRGEGWGRPYMEAMACGLPTIGTRGSGNEDFMHDGNSFLVDVVKIPVNEEAVQEIPVFAGHHWNEPDAAQLRSRLRYVFENRTAAKEVGRAAAEDIQRSFSFEALGLRVSQALDEIERQLLPAAPRNPLATAIGLELEGEFFAGHSFSNINESLALAWSHDSQVEVTCTRRFLQPVQDRITPAARKLRPYLNRSLGRPADVVIRHAFPPNWSPPANPVTKWVHIQPWEFGVLPVDWISPLKYQVDEIWAPSEYVKEVYVRSGIPAEKIVTIPWGIDECVYHPAAPPLHLATRKGFKFLFVGGAIGRKGFDTLLEAYRQEFARDEDVSLVIKDLGTQSFYRYGHAREALQSALEDPKAPEIVYLDADFTDGQRASLYTACQVLVAPYRGEGFGLPVLEAMACGLVPVVPRGGPTDDFTREAFTEYLDAQVVPTQHDWRLVGTPTELSIEVAELRRALRRLFENRQEISARGELASQFAHENHSWKKQILPIMADRLRRLRDDSSPPVRSFPALGHLGARAVVPHCLPISACFVIQNGEDQLADSLARIAPFVQEICLVDLSAGEAASAIAQEYGAKVISAPWEESFAKARNHALRAATTDWIFMLELGEYLADADWKRLASVLESSPTRVLGIRFEDGHSPNGSQSNVRLVRNDWRIECTYRADPSPIPAILQVAGDIGDSGIKILRDRRSTTAPKQEQRRDHLLHLDLGEHPGDAQILLALGGRRIRDGEYFAGECYFHDALAGMAKDDPRREEVERCLAQCQAAIEELLQDSEASRESQRPQSELTGVLS
jgi:glycosyltransferase involved in cell wall biosynthesis